MATATAVRAQPVEPPIEGVTLNLTPQEAQTLERVCNMVSGTASTRRRHTDAIGRAIKKAGIPDTAGEPVGVDGNITFTS